MPLDVLIIGTGFGSRVVSGCYMEAGMNVKVVSARDAQAVRAACEQPFDLVSVHSPPFLHAEHVNLALEHGRHVLCDKPFGVSARQARQMLERASAAGVIHLLNFEFRCDPARARVKQVVDSGEVGRVTRVNWSFFNALAAPPRAHGWQFEAEGGGGWVRIHATHMIDTVRWILGDIAEVECRTRIDVPERPDGQGVMRRATAEDGFTALLRTAGGAEVVMDTSWVAPVSLPDRWTVVGTQGVIDIAARIVPGASPQARETEVRIVAGGEDRTERFGPFIGDATVPGMRGWAVKVREAVETRTQIAPSFVDGVATADIVERMTAK